MLTYDAITPLSPELFAALLSFAIALAAISAIWRHRKTSRLRRELDQLAARITALEDGSDHRPIRRVDSGPLVPVSAEEITLVPPASFRGPRFEQDVNEHK